MKKGSHTQQRKGETLPQYEARILRMIDREIAAYRRERDAKTKPGRRLPS